MLQRSKTLSNTMPLKKMNIKIVHPDSKKEINLNEKNEYNFFENIPDLFLGDDSSITNTQSDFYSDVKFPNYDNLNDFASLFRFLGSLN